MRSRSVSKIIIGLLITISWFFCWNGEVQAECSESGNFLVCEDWDSGTPPSGWPSKGDSEWHGWEPADYGDIGSSGGGKMSTSIYRSAPRAVQLIKDSGAKSTADIAHAIPGSPSKVHVRFYLYIPSGQVEGVGSFAHMAFLNTATTAEVALDFRKHGEKTASGQYLDKIDPGKLLAVHSYDPEVWVGNNTDGNFFDWTKHANEWVLVEWMVDFGKDKTSLWINEKAQVLDYSMNFSGSGGSSVIFSGFTQETGTAINYYIDDVAVSTSYIGARGGSSTPPPPPEPEPEPEPTPVGDTTAPTTSGHNPVKNATNVSPDTNIVLHVKDDGDGVNQSSIQMRVDGQLVSPSISGSAADLTVTYQPPQPFAPGQSVSVTVSAQDKHSPANIMAQESYIFTTACQSGDVYSKIFGNAAGADFPGTTQDTYLTTDDINHAAETEDLKVYTYPANTAANRIVMKWNLDSLPANAIIQEATLSLYMYDYEGTGGDDAYTLTVHKVINHNPVLSASTWDTYNGTNGWTGGSNGGERDMDAAESSTIVNKTPGYKNWNITRMVQEWVADASSNFGLIINPDLTSAADSNRYFRPTDYNDPSQRPRLTIKYCGSEATPGQQPPGQTTLSIEID